MTDSDESSTFQKAYYKLSLGITNPEALAGMLWSRKFITAIERQEAEHVTISAHHRTIKLLDTISKKIAVQPEKLDEFVRILECDPSLAPLARLLNPRKKMKW